MDPFALGIISPFRLRYLDGIFHDGVDIELKKFLAGFLPRKLLKSLDRLSAVPRHLLNRLESFSDLFLFNRIKQELCVPENGGKGIIEIVSHAAGHLSQGS